jgi:hypothetical protein
VQEYWQRLIYFDLPVEEGMIAQPDLRFFSFVANVQQAWNVICQHMLSNH